MWTTITYLGGVMNREELDLLEEMYTKAVLAARGEGDYIDPKADMKADVLAKALGILKSREYDDDDSDETFTYKTKSRHDFMLVLYSRKLVGALYDILCWNRAIYNGKDYGEGSVIYRSKLYSSDEWHKMTGSLFNDNVEVDYDWDRKVYIDKDGEVPEDEVFYVYTKDQINDKLEDLLRDVYSFVYDFME